MKSENQNTSEAESNVKEVQKDIENLVDRLKNMKDKGADVMSEQVDNLFNAISELKNKGEKKGRVAVSELASSTRNHPLRNLAAAFGLGVLFSFIIK